MNLFSTFGFNLKFKSKSKLSQSTGNFFNEAHSGATSTLSAILGRMSAETHKEIEWKKMINPGQQFDINLNLKQFDK